MKRLLCKMEVPEVPEDEDASQDWLSSEEFEDNEESEFDTGDDEFETDYESGSDCDLAVSSDEEY